MIKEYFKLFYKRNFYELWKVRNATTEKGTAKKLSFKEFYELVGITVKYYEDNIDLFKDMRHDDIVLWLKENPNWNEE